MTEYRRGWRIWALAALAAGSAIAETGPQTASLLRSCDDPSSATADLSARDVVRVHFSLSGYSKLCYKVTATIGDRQVDGYVLGSELPAVREFEREARTHIPALPPPPAPPKVAPDPKAVKESAPPPPVSFAGFRGTDSNGRTVDLSGMRAPNVVLYFWSPMDRSSVHNAQALDYLYTQYKQNGVEIVGISATRANLAHAAKDGRVIWPQVIDSGALAARYHVDADKPYLVLDGDRNVIAAAKSAGDLEPVLREAIKARHGGIR